MRFHSSRSLLVTFAALAIPTLSQAVDWNFESGRLDGWAQSGGTAFANQPTRGNNIVARGRDARFALQGSYFVGTFENHPSDSFEAGLTQGDGPTGRLTSDLVTLTGNHFSCLLGGGQDIDRENITVIVKATPANRTRFEVDPRDPDTGRSVPYTQITLPDGQYYIVLRETGRNEEAMRRVSITMPYVRAGDQARVRISDISGGPWGHINVDDIQLGVATTGSLASRIHVTDDENANVEGAEVFVNGALRGKTNAAGLLSAGIVRAGDRIVARKLIREERTYRGGHQTGSTQNWKFRIYQTSLPIRNDGSAPPVIANGDSARAEEVKVSRSNVLFGMNVNVSVEWDTTRAEIDQIRQDLRDASAYFYNATDGQFVFEQVDLRTDARGWNNADFRVHADQNLRPHTDIPFGWFDPGTLAPGLIHMTRSTNGWNGPPVYTHEFGHYGLGLFDEYADLLPYVVCTGAVTGTTSPYGANQPKSSCMMWLQGTAAKICSAIPANPHNYGTWQGFLHLHDCWSSILDTYGARPNDFVYRYTLKSPVTRGAIVGTLPAMPTGWEPRFVESLANHGEYRGPLPLVVTDGSTPREGVGVWLRTVEGRDIYQGKTDATGAISVLGCHVLDTVRFDGREVRVRAAGGLFASIVPGFTWGDEDGMAVVLPANPPVIRIGAAYESGPNATLRIKSEQGKFDETPKATIAFEPGSQPVALKCTADPTTGAYLALLPANSPNGAIVTVEGTVSGTKLIANATVTLLDSVGGEADFHSSDGGVVLKVQEGDLPKSAKVAIAPSAESLPPSEGHLLAGPYSISSTIKPTGKNPLVLSFHLEPTQKIPNPKNLRILRYFQGKWTELPTPIYGPTLNTAALPIDQLGTYALIQK